MHDRLASSKYDIGPCNLIHDPELKKKWFLVQLMLPIDMKQILTGDHTTMSPFCMASCRIIYARVIAAST